MAKRDSRHVCQACGAVHSKWMGRCEACGAWNSVIEEATEAIQPKGLGVKGGRALTFEALEGESPSPPRALTGIPEFDRVLGGGLVAGSAVLVGGDPGIGKSTLLLQAAAALSRNKLVAYVSGEEAIDQVRLRAARLGLAKAKVALAATTSVRDVLASLDAKNAPDVIVIDSIQTMYVDTLDSAPGTVAQVRASASELIRLGKKRGIAILLVGHVTKEGLIAGPRVLEHMVDTVLYFEGERGHHFRILRAVKNRFGPTDEIGVFEMTDRGLVEVPNPSQLFLADRREDVSGAAVFAGMEGTRPVLVEIQALVGPPVQGTPRRAVIGWDSSRLAMVLAVLETRCGLVFASHDVYLNIAGGLRITEPAADLAVAAALISALAARPVPADAVVFGEIGLGGEVRAVSQGDARLKEATKLGFARAFVPAGRRKERGAGGGISVVTIDDLGQLIARLADGKTRGGQAKLEQAESRS